MQQLFKHVVVPLDQSGMAESALEPAASLALAFGATLSLVRVIEPDCVAGEVQPVDPLQSALRHAQASAYLTRLGTTLRARGLQVNEVVSAGDPAQQVVAHLREREADLLVLSTHGHHDSDVCMPGGHAIQMLFQAGISVLLIRPPQPGMSGHQAGPVLVFLDGSARAEHALPVAAMVAQTGNATLVLAHVLSLPEIPRSVPLTVDEQRLVGDLIALNRTAMERYLDDAAHQMAGNSEVHTRLLVGRHSVEALHNLIAQIDARLVVMSAHGYSGLRRWPYGNVALNLLTYAGVPVLIVQDLNPLEIGAEVQLSHGDLPVGH